MAQSSILRRMSAQNGLRLMHGKFLNFPPISITLKSTFSQQINQKQQEDDDDDEDEQVCSQSVYISHVLINSIQ